MSTVDGLLAELLVERYGAPVPRERHATPRPDMSGYGGSSDTDIAIARRRRILCDALDDAPQNYRRSGRAAA